VQTDLFLTRSVVYFYEIIREAIDAHLQRQPIKPGQEWFWTEQWQAAEREVGADLEAGRSMCTASPEEESGRSAPVYGQTSPRRYPRSSLTASCSSLMLRASMWSISGATSLRQGWRFRCASLCSSAADRG
jgi:hypothetical protein